MKLVGLMPVRNEAWCLGLTLRAALMWCDEVLVLLHACTDQSKRIVVETSLEFPDRVWWIEKADGKWDEMGHRQEMLDCVRPECGATHIAIVDADEILTGNLLESNGGYPLIRRTVANMPKGSCLQLPMCQLRGSLDRYHANGIWGNRWLSVAFQDDPRLRWSGDKFHSREPEYPGGGKLRPYQPIKQGQGGSFHLWGVSERRLKAKHALYKCVERLRWPAKATVEIEREYNLWRSPHDCSVKYGLQPAWALEWTFANVPAEWWAPYKDLMIRYLDQHLENEPLWQEAEVRRLVAEHGAETFKGLDLFGVV
jgi:hypothetical protein